MASGLRSARGAYGAPPGRGAALLAALLCVFALVRPSDVVAATLTVTSTADSGAGSLREAIDLAGAGDTIEFLVAGTITLTTGPLVVTRDLTINALAQRTSPSAGDT